MTDHFALFGVPRQPWLEEESLQERFHELSRECHPDRVHGQAEPERRAATDRHAALNAAHRCLSDPRARVAHLLELERGEKPRVVQDIPEALMQMCMEVGGVCRSVDAFLVEKEAGESPMLQARRFARAMEHQDTVNGLLERLRNQVEALHAELKSLNDDWNGAKDSAESRSLSRLEEIWRRLSYLNRWMQQLKDRNVHLMI